MRRMAAVLPEALESLQLSGALNTNLSAVLNIIQARYTDIIRISYAAFDAPTSTLKTFLTTAGIDEPMSHFEARITPIHPLFALRQNKVARLKRRLNEHGDSFSARRLREFGAASSYAVPLFDQERFLGIMFFASSRASRFDSVHVCEQIDVMTKLLEVMIVGEQRAVQSVLGTAKTLKEVAKLRDDETGAHLERMAHYSRIITKHLAPKYRLDDEYIENVFSFAPLHDIGKVAIPDSILLKAGPLSAAEFAYMKEHTTRGKEIVEQAIANLNMEGKHYNQVLRNIVYCHHENWDGTGYPQGLKTHAIPLEARIIRVADVYDALTSVRPYKDAWSQEKTVAFLREESGQQFDPDCVNALCASLEQIEQVAQYYQDEVEAL